jgi:hypothetical protein
MWRGWGDIIKVIAGPLKKWTREREEGRVRDINRGWV